MSAFGFRFDRFRPDRAGFRTGFAPRKPRHPLLRLALGLLGLGVLLVLVFFSVFVGIAMLAAGLLYRLWKQRGKPVARPARVVDGDYRVLAKPALPRA
ncbi:hypothetical protein [Cognatiluteimonas weifangensis]|uniref:Transmembrane protein n=1 Tax=Cognatiluteimonas weifangensis TaxID=2303539 RepID=A0A372DRV1_9GAMM|nr:hypothetical protein [Luteimonas weifangensis]RFP62082.1 hypothetical protein D0Y53_03255 [Luteimonas weifangensis]